MRLFAACTAEFAHGLVIARAPGSSDTHDD
ncbi:hypothetical protein CLV40_11349 [Actinokineospora auranticolor]|uniref:Uncharacterized protein n=1 Tax=Actinokineospora auranticolor TaxID=155976 RepID=A0A2S6GK31_9PSEU|nr:hypothetical protein CLV40_11349 [Actinokineospora auranticolor]